MKLAIIGSRKFVDYDALQKAAEKITASEIVSGGAKGTDSLAAKYAEHNGFKLTIFLPKFKTDKSVKYHARYYLERNQQIVDHADHVLAFWDGESKGTKHTIDYAKKQNKGLSIIRFV